MAAVSLVFGRKLTMQSLMRVAEIPEEEIPQHGILLVGGSRPGAVLNIHALHPHLAVLDGEGALVFAGLVGLDEILAGGVAGAVKIDAVEEERSQIRHVQGRGGVRRGDIRAFSRIASPGGLGLFRHQNKGRVRRQRHSQEEDMLKIRIRARWQSAGHGLVRAPDEVAGFIGQAPGGRQILQRLARRRAVARRPDGRVHIDKGKVKIGKKHELS